jgi:hypothetical protein
MGFVEHGDDRLGRYTEIGQVGERRSVVGPACGDAEVATAVSRQSADARQGSLTSIDDARAPDRGAQHDHARRLDTALTHTGVATAEVRPQRPERGIGVGRGDDRHEQGPASAPGASHLLVRLAPQRDSNPCRHLERSAPGPCGQFAGAAAVPLDTTWPASWGR